MSRSHRKSPVLTDQQHSSCARFFKRQAAKKARKSDLIDGALYRKAYNPYNICDFKSAPWWGNWEWATGGRWDELGYRWRMK